MESYRIDFSHPNHIYFMGIGGVSMSGLAEILLKEGFRVSGSDARESAFTQHLRTRGAEIHYGQRRENITEDIDCAVYTAAIHPDNPEYCACVEHKIPMLTRAELLGQLMRRYDRSIAVSGTHGKTTTTSMLSHVLLSADTDPTISIGGVLPVIGGNIRIGGKGTFLLEACEYTNSFLSFCPTMEIILNIEADHLDFFKDLEDIRSSFRRFVGRLPEDGTVVIDSRIPRYREILDGFTGRVVTVGGEDAEVYAEQIEYDACGFPSFIPVVAGERQERLALHVPGEHNVSNALAAIAAGAALGLSFAEIRSGIEAYQGTARRFEKKGELGGVTIIDDYAHHPQEIEATLHAAQHYPHERLWCVFQPHTYSRTKALLPEFAEALRLADRVVLADIFAARETDALGVSAGDIARRINETEPGKAIYLPGFSRIETYLLETLSPGDLCITMGAGDVYRIGEHLLGKS
ncbi:MAG: UDP-N-acetylmuramate--L-alanine ligase [Stomatobaculum sp.]